MAARARRASKKSPVLGKAPKRVRLAAGGAGEHGLLRLSLAPGHGAPFCIRVLRRFCDFMKISGLELSMQAAAVGA